MFVRFQNSGIAARLGIVEPVRQALLFFYKSCDFILATVQRRRGTQGWLIRNELRYTPTVVVRPAVFSEQHWHSPLDGFDRGGNKMSLSRNGYSCAYSSQIRNRLNQFEVVVELGVFQGASLAMWCSLFPDARVIGLDLDFSRFTDNLPTLLNRGAFQRATPLLAHFDAFSPTPGALERHLSGRKIDLFVDDGPHHVDAIVATATHILPKMATKSLYIIEDLPNCLGPLRAAFPDVKFGLRNSLVVAEIR